jgi:hypothetical protein
LEFITGAGHSSCIEKPQEINRLLKDWLKSWQRSTVHCRQQVVAQRILASKFKYVFRSNLQLTVDTLSTDLT